MPDFSAQNPQINIPFGNIQPTQWPTYDFGQTLDRVMNNAIQYKIAQNQLQSQQAEQNINYGAFGTTQEAAANPQNWKDLNALPQAPQLGQGQGMFQNPGQPIQPSGMTNQHFATLQGLQNLVRSRQTLYGLGIAGQQAGVAKTGAEAQQLQGMNSLLGFGNQGQISTGGSPLIDGLIEEARKGNLSQSQLTSIASRWPEPAKLALANAIAKSGINWEQNENTFQAQQSGQQSQAKIQYGTGQTLGTTVGTLEDVLNQVQPLISKLSPTSVKALNDAWTKGLAGVVGDKNATRVLAYMNEARGLYSSVLANGQAPQTVDKEMAQESIGRGLTPEGFSGMKEAVLFAGRSKIKRITGQGYNEPSQATKSGKYDNMTTEEKLAELKRQLGQ